MGVRLRYLCLPLEEEPLPKRLLAVSAHQQLPPGQQFLRKKKKSFLTYFFIRIDLIVWPVAGASAGSVIPPNATQLQEGGGRPDQLTRGVPVASLSKEELEPGDNLIDFILFFVGLGEARRRHFNRAPPRVLTFPSSPESCQRPVAY